MQFTNLVNPAEKLSGAYNFNASLYYKAEDETVFRSKAGSPFGVYDFSGNPVRQFIEITIPADWNGDSYSLEGAIKMTTHLYSPMSKQNYNGVGIKPDFDIPLDEALKKINRYKITDEQDNQLQYAISVLYGTNK